MSGVPWQPWHRVVTLRDDVRTGELSLAAFAADLYDVAMGRARPMYGDPREFFALTYATYSLRELVRAVTLRLAGRNDKAVQQLQLTYGGGKTHTLITLYHLVHDPGSLSKELPAVRQFVEHAGEQPPQARVAVLAFDKLDLERGTEVRAPAGATRWLKHPWSVLAYGLAGDEGLRLLHADGLAEERETPPAQNLLETLLALPANEGLATLVLMDEVLMYARGKVGQHPIWRERLVDFFQYLTQAAVKAPRCAIVASLLASDIQMNDELGKQLTHAITTIFRRETEASVEPVAKEDVAEVLRRRFFTPAALADRDAFRPQVLAALRGIRSLDDETRRSGPAAEERFLASYPFHPDLTEVFYSKWTQLEGFQRTRGVLRTFALALRDAEPWDTAPLVGPAVFLSRPEQTGLSEAARELAGIAATEEYEGKRQEWGSILTGELAKAQDIQTEGAGLHGRELEAAVMATFLHSQPIGQKAQTRELLLLLGATQPDRIELEKGLARWAENSWFLDDAALGAPAEGGSRLPHYWRLGSRPNLRQMHHDARTRLPEGAGEARLLQEIAALKSLTAEAAALGAKVHVLPRSPADVEDDGEFHYAVLGPKTAADPGRPSAEARRYLEETTSPDRPRVRRNAVVLAVPSTAGLQVALAAVQDFLAWEEVAAQLAGQDLDAARSAVLVSSRDAARRKVPEVLRQAYAVVVTLGEQDTVEAFKVTPGTEPLFRTIKDDRRSRIQDSAVDAAALLPGGPFDLWRGEETSRRVAHLVGAFAELPRLPKMLNRGAILETLVAGCASGAFVLRLTRPDRSLRTFWRERPDTQVLKEPSLEVVLPEAATLTSLVPALLAPDALPGLWRDGRLPLSTVRAYFAGEHVEMMPRDGYEEPVSIPQAEPEVVNAAVGEAVARGFVWLIAGQASVFQEPLPPELLTDEAMLHAPPAVPSPNDLLPERLPEAWVDDATNARAIAASLSRRAGLPLPWAVIKQAISDALRLGLLERLPDSGHWPCAAGEAAAVVLRVPAFQAASPSPYDGRGGGQRLRERNVRVAETTLSADALQDLSDQLGAIRKAAVGYTLRFTVRLELGSDSAPTDEVVAGVNALLADVAEEMRLA